MYSFGNGSTTLGGNGVDLSGAGSVTVMRGMDKNTMLMIGAGLAVVMFFLMRRK